MRLFRRVSRQVPAPVVLALAAFISIGALVTAALLDRPEAHLLTLISVGTVLGAVATLHLKTSYWLWTGRKSARDQANQAANKAEYTAASRLSTAMTQIGGQLKTTQGDISRVKMSLDVQTNERIQFESQIVEQVQQVQLIREQISLQNALMSQLDEQNARRLALEARISERHDIFLSQLDVHKKAQLVLEGQIDDNKDQQSALEIRLDEQGGFYGNLESRFDESLSDLSRELERDRALWQNGKQSLTDRIAQSESEFTTKLALQIEETEKRLRDTQAVIIKKMEAERGLWLEKLEALRDGLHIEIESSRRQMRENLDSAAGLIREALQAGFESERESHGTETRESYDRLVQQLAGLEQTQQSIIDRVEKAGAESLREIEGITNNVTTNLQSGGELIDKTLEELETFLTKQKEITQVFPRVVKLNTLISSGCMFQITTPVEVFRVEKYGNEKDFTAVILAELKKTDSFFDIGASVGLVSVHAGKNGVSTFAFEPDPQVAERLNINVKLNRLTNVKVVDWAVSDSESEVVLYTDGVDGRSPSLREVGERGSTTVKTDTIDNAIRRKELPVPDVIKIDIEGAEALAIAGMNELLASDSAPRTLFVELHPQFLPDFGSTAEQVVELIESFGYAMDHEQQRADQVHCIFRKPLLVPDRFGGA